MHLVRNRAARVALYLISVRTVQYGRVECFKCVTLDSSTHSDVE